MSNWYSDKENKNCVTVSTRIRLARNLSDLAFPSQMTNEAREELKLRMKSAIKQNNSPLIKSLKYIDMADVPENEINAMVERHVISPEFARTNTGKAIILSDDESISIMVGEEDHIRIQVILAGLCLEKAYKTAQELDSILNEKLSFAFDPKLGYLTECPTNLGTGLRASVMMHLPLLESTGQLKQIGDSVGKIGFTVRGIYGEGSKAKSSLYQISNQITLGLSEENAIKNLSQIVEQIIEKERKAEGYIEKIVLEDKILRAKGVLENCRLLTSEEMMNLLSLINLGIRLGIINSEYETIKLLIEAGPYMLMKKYGTSTPEERDIKRAEYVREQFEAYRKA
ncbi:MAG: protein arginine kinase [Clostridia bacterium]|nr:protein arginine kinase [Clostridia bacterium]